MWTHWHLDATRKSILISNLLVRLMCRKGSWHAMYINYALCRDLFTIFFISSSIINLWMNSGRNIKKISHVLVYDLIEFVYHSKCQSIEREKKILFFCGPMTNQAIVFKLLFLWDFSRRNQLFMFSFAYRIIFFMNIIISLLLWLLAIVWQIIVVAFRTSCCEYNIICKNLPNSLAFMPDLNT